MPSCRFQMPLWVTPEGPTQRNDSEGRLFDNGGGGNSIMRDAHETEFDFFFNQPTANHNSRQPCEVAKRQEERLFTLTTFHSSSQLLLS